MPAVKIISDPYNSKISLFRYDDAAESWIEINSSINKNSELIKEKYRTGFFPFILEDLVGDIYKEYHEPNNTLKLMFEGSEDEYNDLEMLCTSDKYRNIISLEKSARYLENARDILPEIVKEFNPKAFIINASLKTKVAKTITIKKIASIIIPSL